MSTELDHDGFVKKDPGHIITYTGRSVNPLDPALEDIVIEDIAHALAFTCRYGGHSAGHLSVARHSLWVAARVWSITNDTVLTLTGLLHDASEAYLGDMVKPLKHHPSMEVFRQAEARVEGNIADRFDLPYPFPAIIHEADRYVTVELELGAGEYRHTFHGWPTDDEVAFRTRYEELQERRKREGG